MNDKRENTLPKLVKKVKRVRFVDSKDLLQLNNLSAAIFNEWQKVRSKLREKIHSKKINDRSYAELEAEEEIVVGLLSLLNEKIVNFITHLFDALFHGSNNSKK